MIAAGRAAVADAASVQDILTKHRATPAFIVALQAKTGAFERLVDAAEAARGERVGTDAEFSEPARRAKKIVEKLAPPIKRKYRNNPQKLTEWLVASHIEQPPKSPKSGSGGEESEGK